MNKVRSSGKQNWWTMVAPTDGKAEFTHIDPSVEVARYIGDMTQQMISMADAAGLDLAAYFLKMARAECEAAAANASPSIHPHGK